MEESSQTEESVPPLMSVEEARNVMWLRNKPEFCKPMGVLLDEGYLSRDRLEWAAQKAYDPRLKQAATVLLNSLIQSVQKPKIETSPTTEQGQAPSPTCINVDITIERARDTTWPLPPSHCKGQPMGPLFDSRQLTLKDLGYAIENAWDERVKKAAIVFTLQRLNQTMNEPPPSIGPLRIVSGGRSYAEIKQLQLAIFQGALIACGILAIIFLYGLFVANANPIFTKVVETQIVKKSILFLATNLNLHVQQPNTSLKIAIYAVIIPLTLIIWLLIWEFVKHIMDHIGNKIWKNLDNYRQGQEGENKTVERMISNLNKAWCVFRNVLLPGRKKTDLDLVLVGPPGVWVLEVKNYKGDYKNIGEDWQYRSEKGFNFMKKSPSKQAQNNAVRLHDFLEADGIKQYVNSVVIWANEESPLTVENPKVKIWRYDRLPEELGNICEGKPMEKSQQDLIETKLEKLCNE